MNAYRLSGKVAEGRTITVRVPEASVGSEAEIIVLFPKASLPPSASRDDGRVLRLESQPRSKSTADEEQVFLRQLRNEWGIPPCLGSSVVINAVESASTVHPLASAALSAPVPGAFCVSDLVRMECLIRPIRDGDATRIAVLAAFFNAATLFAMDSKIFDLAARLRADHSSLRTPDALHLATALRHGCGEFWTNDLDLARRNVGLTFRSF